MAVISPGSWIGNALQLRMDLEEYHQWIDGLAHDKQSVTELAERAGSQTTEHYLLVEGHRVLVYVTKPEKTS